VSHGGSKGVSRVGRGKVGERLSELQLWGESAVEMQGSSSPSRRDPDAFQDLRRVASVGADLESWGQIPGNSVQGLGEYQSNVQRTRSPSKQVSHTKHLPPEF
jgi:hypothetical protein